MNRAAIYHVCGGSYAFPVNKNTLRIRLRAARNDLDRVVVVYGTRYPGDGEDPYLSQEMELVACDELHDYYEADIRLDDARFRYHFYLEDVQESLWLNEKGFFEERPRGFFSGFFQYPLINYADIFSTPDWVKDAVFYHIFPERFYNGDPSNDPRGVSPWGGKPGRKSFFGGDLEGIIKKLDYIESLGVKAIYLTPVFKSPSNHKYNIDDYFQIDPHFGDLETARRMVIEAHRRGIKIIFDAVFNHCGYDFFAFKDVRQKGEKSQYKDWFEIESFPVQTDPTNYRTFANNIARMPKLMTGNPEVREYLINVATYWIKELDIDGWRLDVADEVDHHFWREMRKAVKEIKEDAYIVGEVWHNSEDWLQGDQFDAIMNYPFTYAVIDFFARNRIDAGTFDAQLAKNRMLYQDSVNYVMLNLLDSHDTPRALHFFEGNKEKFKLAVLFQMTYLGAPMVYYGDELGMTGGEEPASRGCMVWDKENQDQNLLDYYKKLISIRNKLTPLLRGNYKTILVDNIRNIYGFTRHYRGQSVMVIINNSPRPQQVKIKKFKNRGTITDHLSGQTYNTTDGYYLLDLLPYQGLILE
ncbi:alpha-glycosidase [Halothermothrix orenii]|uniref:Alpha amylase catalytic region n=1 Tax=Halothermothrix orenii (strain H 168 / OCM 544 / DSM 9562) TaxID=373903 RepID=B8CYJ6_HALOH|nr:alpha-glycosidase [Halothermothrix orenii]ACL70365.1 alpha amylase catalytic region [Halothermothrix orenii H 168]